VLGDLTLAIPLLALAGTSFLLGARHGLDWDHIAAITDLTSPRKGDEDAPHRHGARGLGLALAYCLGHGLVLAVFAGLILLLGIGLPSGLDAVFEYLVGLTLVTLGAVVLYQLGRYRSDYRYTGRISLVVGALRRGWARTRRREVAEDAFVDVDRRGAFLVGLLHGTGASTPTQVVLFATTAAAGSTSDAAVVLAAFVLGLIVTDLGVAAAWVSGLIGTRRAPSLQLGLGVVTGVASVTLGALILAGYGDLVPPLVAE
jgi:high-affinity nickel permease